MNYRDTLIFPFVVNGKKMKLVHRPEMDMWDDKNAPSKPKKAEGLRPANLEELTACLESAELREFMQGAWDSHVIALDTRYPLLDDIIDKDLKNRLSHTYFGKVSRVKGIAFKEDVEISIYGYDFDGYDIGERWYQPPWDERFWFLFAEEPETKTPR